ncbi:MAG: Formamidopyrimidine-DNA glycosylase [Myxococcaceae bacterium]|nr:Formamidopyrimidine-DNA glycosylase [Myxococcaceae bacterium]
MPELPEVEFARRVLAQWTEGRTITRARVADARILDEGVKAPAVVRALAGRAVVSVARRGKWLRIALDDTKKARLLFSHLGMTGRWQETTVDAPELRFEKVRLDLARGAETSSLRYTDPRLFGRFVVATEELPAWKALGPDPLIDGVDAAVLAKKLARRKKKTIKETLLDQSVLAGIGNIQAQEALFRAKLHPERMASDLSPREVRVLATALLETIHATLALTPEGETKIVYVEEAGADNPFAIYGREGEPCPRCTKALVKIVQGGRSTIFCARCQRIKDVKKIPHGDGRP